MSDEIKKGKISFAADKPMQLIDAQGEDIADPTPEQKRTIDLLGSALKEYLKATKDLLSGKYAHLREIAPQYLSDPGNVLLGCCAGGAVIRFEKRVESSRVIAAWSPKELPELASMVSQCLIQCHSSKQFTSPVGTTGPELKLSTIKPTTNEEKVILVAKIGFDTVVEIPSNVPLPPLKPFCLLSIRNTLEIELLGELIQDNSSHDD